MAMNIILWIVFGAIVGWIASLIMNTNQEMGAMANITVGIVGAFLGGIISRLFGGPTVTGFNLGSFIIAIIGAIVLLGLVRVFGAGNRHGIAR
ncbi:MAG: Transglycosylase-associated protein [Candidatus Saccharibacteria bacterium]|nr:Transglycosylase-associated protein [Candidatus Saccharibacteria bacterium]